MSAVPCTDFVCTMGDVYVLMAAAGFLLWGGKWLWDRRTKARREAIRQEVRMLKEAEAMLRRAWKDRP